MEGRGRGVRIPGSLEGGAHCVAQQDPLCATVQLTSSHALVLRAHMKGTLTTFSGRITQGAVVALSAAIQMQLPHDEQFEVKLLSLNPMNCVQLHRQASVQLLNYQFKIKLLQHCR